jgi:hypothetical protein
LYILQNGGDLCVYVVSVGDLLSALRSGIADSIMVGPAYDSVCSVVNMRIRYGDVGSFVIEAGVRLFFRLF